MPRVSVVIPAYNAERFIGACLDSVAGQTFRDFEVIVADDGSCDRTAEIAASRHDVIVLSRPNGGPAAARNEAIERGSGELIALLDADDTWRPAKLERQVGLLGRRPEVLLATTGVERPDGTPHPKPVDGQATGRLLEENFVTTSSVLVRRAALASAGGFDTDPGLISVEDYDLWLRLSLLGPFAGLEEPLVHRRLHESNLSRDHLKLYRRTLRVIEKFAGLEQSRRWQAPIAARRAELCCLVARGHLSRGERVAARRALRGGRRSAPRLAPRFLVLEALSWLPRSLLLKIHDVRRERRASTGTAGNGGRRIDHGK